MVRVLSVSRPESVASSVPVMVTVTVHVSVGIWGDRHCDGGFFAPRLRCRSLELKATVKSAWVVLALDVGDQSPGPSMLTART